MYNCTVNIKLISYIIEYKSDASSPTSIKHNCEYII